MNKIRPIIGLLALLLITPVTVLGQITKEVEQHIDRLSRIDESKVSRYSDKYYTYDEEYFAEKEPGTIFYPTEITGKAPAVIIVHGFNSMQKHFAKLGKHLASHGFIVLTYTALDQKRPMQWPQGLMAAYQLLMGENERPDSPIYGHLDSQSVALIGHSMGGAGVLHTSMTPLPNGLGGKIKTVIALNPYNGGPTVAEVGGGSNDELGCDLAKLSIPTLIVTGSYDGVAYPWKSIEFYRSLREPAKRAFLSVDKMTHANWYFLASEPRYDLIRAICYTWLMTYLVGDESYKGYFEDEPESLFFKYIHPYLGHTLNPLIPGSKDFPSYLMAN